MKNYVALAAVLASTAHASPFPVPGGVTENIPASGTPPPGCKPAYPGQFGITVVRINGNSKRR